MLAEGELAKKRAEGVNKAFRRVKDIPLLSGEAESVFQQGMVAARHRVSAEVLQQPYLAMTHTSALIRSGVEFDFGETRAGDKLDGDCFKTYLKVRCRSIPHAHIIPSHHP